MSRDAVLLATLAVLPEFEGQGIGRVLSSDDGPRPDQAEGAGGGGLRRPRPSRPRPAVPAGFLEASGFQVVRDHPRYPLMRMDLRTALTWKDAREAARRPSRSRPPPQPALRPVPSSRPPPR